jgi:hypothetical protein
MAVQGCSTVRLRFHHGSAGLQHEVSLWQCRVAALYSTRFPVTVKDISMVQKGSAELQHYTAGLPMAMQGFSTVQQIFPHGSERL